MRSTFCPPAMMLPLVPSRFGRPRRHQTRAAPHVNPYDESFEVVLPDGRTVRAIYVGTWVVSVWWGGEMLELWEDRPYGVA
ncbi:MAG: hypothetical protein IPM54_01495 [Polyangiaceae bacterium]|nr:hypothetical protein [Polyangiaceae bacterium]